MNGAPDPERPLHIVHYLNAIDLAEGGVVRCVLDLAGAAAKLGHRVTLITRNDKDIPDAWRAGDGVPTVVTLDEGGAGRFGLLSAREKARVRGVLGSAPPDVAHLHTAWQPVNISLASICADMGVPYVLSIHGMLDDWCMAQSRVKKRIYHALFLSKILRRAHAVHCTAAAENDQSKKWYPDTRGVVIPLVFDLDPYRELPGPGAAHSAFPEAFAHEGEDGDGLTLLFLSRINVKKGLEHLLRAAPLLAERGIEARILVAGTGDPPAYAQTMKALAREMGVEDRTHFLGLVTGDTKTSLYQAADVFVLPTSQENFGFVFPEALACATPVITTRGVDTWPELEKSGGARITTQDPGDLADAISLFSDPDARHEAGEAGRARVFEWLDPDRVAREFVALYREAAASR